ncbi:ThiF family adenylyltransferase [Hornefia butyriciproducens]|uniref:THIF-type NAD/FAD binding fold domain-containing protein n=1 Tax=Hornefia butyriciproducens TaxID=2652293 RepID=A0A6L5Y5J4_9FIRM|nr:ThiF family adenylyltransferase [Hornefia butyriciproducens]MST51896.1 hypothetical protein [Hornefia butyriciproducens]
MAGQVMDFTPEYSDSIVSTLVSYEDKIIDCIDRLIELLGMNPVEKEREFQKEFMYYWNSEAAGKDRIRAYLRDGTRFSEMDSFYGTNIVRLVEQGLDLSDIDERNKGERKWTRHLENDVYHIPITDNRGIIPPHRGFQWTAKEVQNIVYGRQVEHISDETFRKLKSIIPKRHDLILLFSMRTEQSNSAYALKVRCKSIAGRTLLDKILSDITEVEPMRTERKDYTYMCEQIGNDPGLLDKRILLVGAGSLGSYVAFELAKNGAKNIMIYDGDILEDENILRWAYGGIGKESNKATTIQFLLNLLHPEIHITGESRSIDVKALLEEISKRDLIIFTIGNSDEQLKFNAALKKANCSKPVLYVWLEEGGTYSHILFANYQNQRCFECLYTDDQGNHVNNRARKNIDVSLETGMIRNGCGGTRAAYGTAVILRTTAALLDTIRDIVDQRITNSTLIDITPDRISISDTEFPMEACNCCGNKE